MVHKKHRKHSQNTKTSFQRQQIVKNVKVYNSHKKKLAENRETFWHLSSFNDV